ncbi:hypothetical protein EWM64_g7111 [Hericium alpestre]|uniref:Uncharacterized protein n=1 Tax=Hericium alpestre TaxID=135208 RepID=A0A4Y9ZQ47_9AGAM|nr:hypothetical protein EWM64_g7111 [Hericium alpestre]
MDGILPATAATASALPMANTTSRVTTIIVSILCGVLASCLLVAAVLLVLRCRTDNPPPSIRIRRRRCSSAFEPNEWRDVYKEDSESVPPLNFLAMDSVASLNEPPPTYTNVVSFKERHATTDAWHGSFV